MSRRRRIRQRQAHREVQPLALVCLCLRCRKARPGDCRCIYPILSTDGVTPLPGVPSAEQRYQAIITAVFYGR